MSGQPAGAGIAARDRLCIFWDFLVAWKFLLDSLTHFSNAKTNRTQ